ncbi:SGNH/GDSL hydrolase family protein, partial [Rhizobium sp.]|uniref:SGNH/GDSL hydrolase family protein n=1 Tax=Rhizobium sp. TaxID=391 RepID=UPI0028A5AD4C
SARDIAAAYASDAVSQGNVPIYGTVSGLSGLNIPAGINAIRLNGFSASGDGGGWPLAKEVPNSGALMAWQRQSNGGTRRWELVVDNPKPEMFGGMGDGADNAAALLNTSDYITARGGGEIVLGGGKNFFSLTEVNFGDVTIRAEPEAKLSGFINMKADFRFDRPVDIHRSGEGGNNYLPLPVTSKHRRPIQEKEVFFTTADGNYSVEIALQPSQLDHVQVQDGADTFFPVSAASTTDRTVTHDLVAGYLRGSEIRARGGDELSVGFENGGFDHVAFIRTTGGYYEVRSNGFAGAASVWFKASGAASAKLFDFDWTGRSDHADWQPGYADWRIRLLSLQRWTLMLNGVDVLFGGVTLASGSLITHVGYGARSSEAIQFSISDWVITRSDDTAGRGYMQVLTCGDSTVAPYHGDWSTYLEELLEGSLGIGSKVKNIGVDGWTMETTYNTLIAHGLTGVNVVVLNAGVNNAQNSNTISIAKTLTDLQAIIEYVQAANVRLIINLHANYYAKGSSGLGVVVYNEQSAPRYRQAIRRMAASYGVKVVDKSSELKPTFKYERDASPPLPVFQDAYRSGLRDNIHDSAARCRAIAHAVCRAIIGLLPRKRRGFDEIDVPASILNTALGFAQPSTNKARISLTDSGDLGLGGEISGGTRTNGNSILAVPENLRPAGPRVFRTLTVNGTSIRLILSSNGSLLIYDAGSDTSNIILDSLRWRVS